MTRASDVLTALYDGLEGKIEFRALPAKTKAWATPGDYSTAKSFCQRKGQNVYFGVALRKDTSSGALANCTFLTCLFADIDFKDIPEAEARERLARCPIAPSIIIATGGGLHVYWLLTEPIDLRTDLETAERHLRALATYLGADPACAEAARVLRLPGSLNHKYNPPRPVVVETFEPERRYNLSDFSEWLPLEARKAKSEPVTVDGPIPEGQRNATLYRLGRALHAKGLPAATILATLHSVNEQQCVTPLSAREVDAIGQQVVGQADRPDFLKGNGQPRGMNFSRPAVSFQFGDSVLAPLNDTPFTGWFQRGAIHLIAGSSGAGKTTLMIDLLRKQRIGATYLGHPGRRHDFLVIFGDRGKASNHETFARMGIDHQQMPVAHIPATPCSSTSSAAILAAVEAQEVIPPVVFIEGADMLVEDPSKPQAVTPFMERLLRMAEHYGMAIVLSVGAPKSKPKEQYQYARDRVFGSIMWGRRADLVCELTCEGDGTSPARQLKVLHRNAAPEIFHLEFRDGLLVPTDAPAETNDYVTWFSTMEAFTRHQFRERFRMSGTRAKELLDGYVAIGILREKVRNDRTRYVYRPPEARRQNRTKTGLSGSGPDTSGVEHVGTESVRQTTGHGHDFEGQTRDFPNVLSSNATDPQIPLKSLSGVRLNTTPHIEPDLSGVSGSIWGKRPDPADEELPAWVTESDGPPPEPGSSDAAFASRDEAFEEDDDAVLL